MSTSNPKVRRDDLLLASLPDELLIYDQQVHQAHCLNAPAAAVFRHADGTRTVAEIATAAAAELQAPLDEDTAWTALEELDKNGLLETPLPLTPGGEQRRRMMAAGAAAILVPLVTAIVAPTPAYAQSGSTGP